MNKNLKLFSIDDSNEPKQNEKHETKLRKSVRNVIDKNSKNFELDFDNVFTNQITSTTKQTDNEPRSDRRIDQAQRTHEDARQIRKNMQEVKRITAEQRTTILKALHEADKPMYEVLELCLECIGLTVNDTAFKRQALKDLNDNYK